MARILFNTATNILSQALGFVKYFLPFYYIYYCEEKSKKRKKAIDKLKNLWYNDKAVKRNGSIAQLGEHLPYKQGVIGSSPIVSTISVSFLRHE